MTRHQKANRLAQFMESDPFYGRLSFNERRREAKKMLREVELPRVTLRDRERMTESMVMGRAG